MPPEAKKLGANFGDRFSLPFKSIPRFLPMRPARRRFLYFLAVICCGFVSKTLITWLLTHAPPEIDLVITYVNGEDVEFRAELERYKNTSSVLPHAIAPARFRDRNDLLYLLRSVDQYGKVFRRVFLVVANERQVPDWINRNNPRLRIVYHRDIWYDASQLPNFNSWAIEANLHHIRDLADIFVYMNDDYAFLDEMHVEDFVEFNQQSGKLETVFFRPDAEVHLDDLVQSKTPPDDVHWVNPALNSRDLLREICGLDAASFSRLIGLQQQHSHIPVVLVKSALSAAEQKPAVRRLLETSWANRFRSGLEINIFHFFFGYVQCTDLFRVRLVDPTDLVYMSVDEALPDEATFVMKMEQIFQGSQRLRKYPRPKFLLVNDHSGKATKITMYGRRLTELINSWRDKLFVISTFEKYGVLP